MSGGGRRREGVRGRFLVGAAAVAAGALAAGVARADEFHYTNLLIGERASGLGGAYTAISDDPSGIFYNPAGMVYGFENYISISANTYNVSQQTFKDIVPGQDYVLKSQGLVPTFFGFSQNWGKDKLAFGIMVPNSELIDQDDALSNISQAPGTANLLRRRFFNQDTTYLFGPAYSRALGDRASIGFSFLGFYRTALSIDNQLIVFNANPSTQAYYIQNAYLKQSMYGLDPKIGVQLMPSPKLSMGATLSKGFNLGGSFNSRMIRGQTTAAGGPVTPNGDFAHDMTVVEGTGDARLATPVTAAAGMAYFFSKTLLVSGDFSYYGTDSSFKDFTLASTWNVAAGSEWFALDWLALRAGAFTNRANTPALVAGGTDQSPHVNLLGGSLSASVLKPGSSFTLGATYSRGTGQGQIIGGTTAVQDVSQTNLSFFLSGSYQL